MELIGQPDTKLPLPHDAYWVTGRLLAGPYAGRKYGVAARDKLPDFLELGVTCFIDLTEEREDQPGEGPLEPYAALLGELAAVGDVNVRYLRMAIGDVRRSLAHEHARDPGRHHRCARRR